VGNPESYSQQKDKGERKDMKSKGMRKAVSLALAVVLVMATMAVPVMAETNTGANVECGTCGDQNPGSCRCCGGAGNVNVGVVELQDSEKNKAIAEALSNTEVKNLKAILIERGYKPKIDRSIANKLILENESGTSEAVVVEITFEKDPSSDIGRIIFTSTGDKTKVGAGIVKKVGDTITVDAFEYKNGELSTQTIKNDNGIISIDGVVIAASSSCDMCISVCNYIYGAGCGLSGYFVCLAACAPFGNVACGPICAVIWALICVYGAGESCPVLCQGYC
jgi:hypothetical protein